MSHSSDVESMYEHLFCLWLIRSFLQVPKHWKKEGSLNPVLFKICWGQCLWEHMASLSHPKLTSGVKCPPGRQEMLASKQKARGHWAETSPFSSTMAPFHWAPSKTSWRVAKGRNGRKTESKLFFPRQVEEYLKDD